MSDSNVQALEKISTEVVESQFKIILSSQCIKAQAFLVEKLRKQSEQTKQICNFISNGNFRLENEIRLGELEIKSLLSALETIKSANVELKKEFLLSKEENIDITERVESGIKKYEALWLTSKKRYDNIPLIKEKLQSKNKEITLENNINSLGCEIQHCMDALVARKNELMNLDKMYIINIAEYMTNERPKLIQCMKEKKDEINNLMIEINVLQNEQGDNRNELKINTLKKGLDSSLMNESLCVMENAWSNITKNNDNENNETVLLPKLQLQNIDLDILSNKLEQIRKADSDKSSIERADSISVIQKNKLDINNIFVSSNLKISINENKDTCQTMNYSEKKLIHILEDIKLHKKETIDIFSKLDTNKFHDVGTIKAAFDLDKTQQAQEKIDDSVEMDQNEVIEEVDLAVKDSSNIVLPPTQFLDLSQGDLLKNSQKWDVGPMEVINTPEEDCTEKTKSSEQKVTFDTASVQDVDPRNINQSQEEITSSQLNTSSGNDDSYNKIKERVFKKHNLELSPQFTYSKNPTVAKISASVTSKFFDVGDNTKNKTECLDINRQTIDNEVKGPPENIQVPIKEVQDSSVAGFLLTHGSKGVPELLDVSMTSTCIEDSDENMYSIDSSLLLSPKGDVVMPASGDINTEVVSQEVPNFLSGFRKVGFSFFGNTSSEKKSDSSNKNLDTDFNFNFGSTEKNSRGGLFNMFH